jgi:uncharacterized membrane protein YfcA
MLLFVEPIVAIPLHGVIQLVSNGSRTIIQRRHVQWPILARYSVLLVPGGILGLVVLQRLPADAMRALIGVFVIFATWAPSALLLGAHPEQTDPKTRFFWLGGVAGLLNTSLGAIGPLIAPFYLNLGLARQQLVGTKAACQMVGHLVKIVLFGAIGFAFGEYALLLGVCTACVIAGTWIGSRLLDRISENAFVALYKTVLTLIALRLVVSAAF